MLFELLVANPRLLELLVKTFDASRHAADILIRRPQLLEDVTRGSLDRNVSVARHLVALRKLGPTAGNLDAVRTYRQAQFLRILIRDVLKLANHAALLAEHSALAEACLIFVHGQVASEGGLTVVAMGKFGGAELTYGADLDVLFIGENTRAAQALVVEMGRTTAEGNIFLLDARLRPDGEKGTLTSSVEACEAYYWTRAQLWEIQALTRARMVCGADGAAFIDVAKRAWRIAGQRDDLFPQIDAMRERIRRDRGTGSEILDYKTGLGGIVEAEFLIQALQMRTGIWQPQFTAAISELKYHGTVSDADAEAIQRSYDLLRRCESLLRRWEGKSVSSLPTQEAEQRKLARRVGAKDLDDFGQKYRAAREIIHAAYERYMR